VSYGLYFAVFNGLSFQYFWPERPAWANQSLLVLLSCTLVFGMHFTRRFLDTRVTAPRLDRVAMLLQVFALAALAGAFFLPYSALIRPLALLTVLVTGLIIALGTLGLVKGYRPARYFMLAWALLLAGVVMNMLKNFGVLPHNILTQNGFQVGSLCEMVLLSLALASRVSEMQRQSRTDALTKVYNRRFFDERVAFEFERAARSSLPISLLVADIDHFKKFNDSFGHARGDEVLKAVARALLEGVRSQDTVCRYGGEEFALILPGTDAAGALVLAEALRQSIEQGRSAAPGAGVAAGSSAGHAAGHGAGSGPVTISIGVASSGNGGIDTVDALFKAADSALYLAKAAGRNRVMLAGASAVHVDTGAGAGGSSAPRPRAGRDPAGARS
jgi:diguanylate cyclase (GGDEF)-like protein